MKKISIYIMLSVFICIFACSVPIAAAEEVNLKTSAKSAYLCDANMNMEIYSCNAEERYPVASMVKIMTALLALEALDKGEIALDEQIRISENAMSMGGSQMFLEANLSYPISDLLKGIIVVSANDACVAVAERIAGGEDFFVEKMNIRAAELGMKNTHFANCTGLPASGGYSCAKDAAIMLSELLKHEVYHNYSTIWLEEYKHPDGRTTVLTNTNKLIRFYEGCDGGKTGFTNEAGFCLSATAVKNGFRAISVVIGEADSKQRFEDSKKLLNYAFANYSQQVLAKKGDIYAEIKVRGAREAVNVGVLQNLCVVTKGKSTDAVAVPEFNTDLCYPLPKGSVVGTLYAVSNGKVISSSSLVTLEDAQKETFGNAFDRVLGKWGVRG